MNERESGKDRERALALVAEHLSLDPRSWRAHGLDQPVLGICSVEIVGLAGLDLPVDDSNRNLQ